MSTAYASMSASGVSTAFGMECYRLNQRRNALPDIFGSVDVIELSRKCGECQLVTPQAEATTDSSGSQVDATSESGGSQADTNSTAEHLRWQPPVPCPSSPEISPAERLSCTSCGKQTQEVSDVDMQSPVKDPACNELISFTDTTPTTKAQKNMVLKGSNLATNNATNKENEREANKENDNKAKGHGTVDVTTNTNEDDNTNILHNNDNLIVMKNENNEENNMDTLRANERPRSRLARPVSLLGENGGSFRNMAGFRPENSDKLSAQLC